MKKHLYYSLLILLLGGNCPPALAQTQANYFSVSGVKEKIDSLHKIAVLPFWVELDPRRYRKLPGVLAAKQTDAGLFMQNLLYAALLRHDSGHKLKDIYTVNEQLARHRADLSQLLLQHPPDEWYDLLGVDALLLGYVSHNGAFLTEHPQVSARFRTIPWAQPPRDRNTALVLWHRTGYPLWVCALTTRGVGSTLWVETQLWIGDVITLQGYKPKP